MINKCMNDNEENKATPVQEYGPKPDEHGGFYFSSHLKITDPNTKEDKVKPAQEYGPKPDEHGGFYFSSHLKITDPNTKEVLVQTRGDN